jgi:hypothetical protein
MTSRDALIAPHVQAFFAQHLAQHKRVSPICVKLRRASCGSLYLIYHRDNPSM